jgi:hypothetical protein
MHARSDFFAAFIGLVENWICHGLFSVEKSNTEELSALSQFSRLRIELATWHAEHCRDKGNSPALNKQDFALGKYSGALQKKYFIFQNASPS